MREKLSWAERLAADFSIMKSLIFDATVQKVSIVRPDGGSCECQIRSHRKTSDRYLVLKMQGGEGDIWVPFDKEGALQLAQFVQDALSEKKSENC